VKLTSKTIDAINNQITTRGYFMKAKSLVLTREERDVIVLSATPQGDRYLNNTEISQRLGIPVSKVKILLYRTFLKLGATNRNEAQLFAIKRGEIKLNEIYTLDELVEFFYRSLGPDIFRRILHIMRNGLQHDYLPRKDEKFINYDRRRDTILTEREQDILILIGRGLTNREIADTLYISTNSVRTLLYQVYTKLGVHKRTEAAMLALKRGEISMGQMYSFNELVELLASLGAESLEKIAEMLSQNFKQEPIQLAANTTTCFLPNP